MTDLFKKGLTWVLSRFHIEITRYPKWGETVQINTWPSGRGPLFAVRDYEILDAEGPLAAATSSWLIVDLKTPPSGPDGRAPGGVPSSGETGAGR